MNKMIRIGAVGRGEETQKQKIQKLKEKIEILEIEYQRNEDESEYNRIVSQGLGIETEYSNKNELKYIRIRYLKTLIKAIEKNDKYLEKETIKDIKQINKQINEETWKEFEEWLWK